MCTQDLDDPSTQRAIISLDSNYAEEFVNHAAKVPVVTYSKFSGADVYSVSVQYTMWDTEIVIHTPLGRMRVVTGLIGELNVQNVLAAVAAAISINIPLDAILEGLEAVDTVPGRMEIIDEGQQPAFPVMVDIADTPKRLERLLENARLVHRKVNLLLLPGLSILATCAVSRPPYSTSMFVCKTYLLML